MENLKTIDDSITQKENNPFLAKDETEKHVSLQREIAPDQVGGMYIYVCMYCFTSAIIDQWQ